MKKGCSTVGACKKVDSGMERLDRVTLVVGASCDTWCAYVWYCLADGVENAVVAVRVDYRRAPILLRLSKSVAAVNV